MNIRNELFDILAVTDILTSIEIKNPEMHIVNVQIAYIIETYNHRKSALKYYRQFLKKNGNSCTNSEIYLRMGKIFETLKDEENAKKAYIKAYESNKEILEHSINILTIWDFMNRSMNGQ